MIPLILDSNIWIEFLAKDQNGIYALFMEKLDAGDVFAVTNDVIIEEWKRNKESTINKIKETILKEAKPAKTICEFLSEPDKKALGTIIDSAIANREKLALDRVEELERILMSSPKMEVTDEMKLKAVEFALLKKAPFSVKGNSVADALILFSALSYFKDTDFSTRPYFITFNHTDFSNPENRDEIHPDLKSLLEGTNIQYTRNLAEALNLSSKMVKEINDYLEYMIERHYEMLADIERGK